MTTTNRNRVSRPRRVRGLALGSTLAVMLFAAVAGPSTLGPYLALADTGATLRLPANPPGEYVGVIRFEAGLLRDGPPPFAWVTESAGPPTLRSVIRAMESAGGNAGYRAVVLDVTGVTPTLAQVDELTAAMKRLREQGKQSIVFASEFSTLTYLLACSADAVAVREGGDLMLGGLAVEEFYMRDLLGKVGLTPDFVQVGRFKGAEDPFMRSSPGEDWSRNIDGLLDDLYAHLLDGMMTGRGLTREQAEKALGDAWSQGLVASREAGLVDAIVAGDARQAAETLLEGATVMVDLLGGDAPVTVENPFTMLTRLFQAPPPRIRRASIALIELSGPIMPGDSGMGQVALLGPGASIGSDTVTAALAEARENPLIRGVMLRLTSPGGSASASDVIWQAVRQTSQVKPVYVSIESMAASGGYYIACAADRVYVLPSSLLGSIGVVVGKLALGDLYDKIGLGVVRRTRGPVSGLSDSTSTMTPEQREGVRQVAQRIYDQFTARVAEGRGERLPDVEAVAQGRLFTGRQAVTNGMADELGGLPSALRDLAGLLDLKPGEYDVVRLPAPVSLGEFIERQFGAQGPVGGLDRPAGGLPTDVLHAARAILGPIAWPAVRDVALGLSLLRDEPILTLTPTPLVVR